MFNDVAKLGCEKSLSFIEAVSMGYVKNWTFINKFGNAENVGTSFVPVTSSQTYQTPTALTSLEAVSSSADDAAGGSGLQKIKIEGIGTDWAYVEEEITLNGTTPVALANQYFRVFMLYGIESGTYATASASSHVGTITIQETGGGDIWDQITLNNGLGLGQSEIGAYTVAKGYTAFIPEKLVVSETNKTADVYLFARDNADDVTTPYTGIMKVKEALKGVTGYVDHVPQGYLGPFVGPCE